MVPRRRRAALVALLLAGCTSETRVVREPLPTITLAPVPTTAPTAPLPPTTSAPTTVAATAPATTSTTAPTTTSTTASTTIPGTTLADTPTTVGETNAVAAARALPVPQPPPAANAPDPNVALGTIEIPRLGLAKPLYEGITVATLNRGPGHWPGTAIPGQLGNVVVGGHRTSKGRPFRHLEELQPGDEVIFTTEAGRFVYHVVRTEIVTPEAMWIINQTEAFTATLFACHPVGSTKERIVVFLELGV